eukprot:scaffold223021_cov24-Tisochrysis_lutea.AAC.2
MNTYGHCHELVGKCRSARGMSHVLVGKERAMGVIGVMERGKGLELVGKCVCMCVRVRRSLWRNPPICLPFRVPPGKSLVGLMHTHVPNERHKYACTCRASASSDACLLAC